MKEIHNDIKDIISKLEPEVAEHVLKKWNQDTEDFNTALTLAKSDMDLSDFADKNCKKPNCYGRGYTSNYLGSDIKVECQCVAKGYLKFVKEFRASFNSDKKEETNGTQE